MTRMSDRKPLGLFQISDLPLSRMFYKPGPARNLVSSFSFLFNYIYIYIYNLVLFLDISLYQGIEHSKPYGFDQFVSIYIIYVDHRFQLFQLLRIYQLKSNVI